MNEDAIRNYVLSLYGDDRDWQQTIDPDIADLIQDLNRLPRVVTLASCAGHGISGATGKSHKDTDVPYIYLVCKSQESQYLILAAFRDIDGDQEFQSKFKEIDGPLLHLTFKSYDQVVRFQDNLHHEVQELNWRKSQL